MLSLRRATRFHASPTSDEEPIFLDVILRARGGAIESDGKRGRTRAARDGVRTFGDADGARRARDGDSASLREIRSRKRRV